MTDLEDDASVIITSVLTEVGLDPVACRHLTTEIRLRLWLGGQKIVPRAEADRAGIGGGWDLSGMDGAMLRFLKRLDLEQVRGWVNEELARGTGPSDRFQVAVSASAFILAQAILSVKERGRATSDVLAAMPGAVHARIQEAVDAAKPRVVGGTER